MNNICLITKLKSSVSNESLTKIGEAKIELNKGKHHFSIGAINKQTMPLRLYGDAHFTDANYSEDKGKEYMISTSSSLYILCNEKSFLFFDKNLLKSFIIESDAESEINVEDLSYCKNFEVLYCYNKLLKGDVSVLNTCNIVDFIVEGNKNLYGDGNHLAQINISRFLTNNTNIRFNIENLNTSVINMNSTSKEVSGNISYITNLVNLKKIDLENTSVSGSTSSLQSKNDITHIMLIGTDITGDMSDFSNMNNIVTLTIPKGITGNISSLYDKKNLKYFHAQGNVSGDISMLASEVIYYFSVPQKSNMSWKATKKGEMLSISGVNFGDDLDAMLVNMAQLDKNDNVSIQVFGTRTSASDTAIATLQSKGVNISITSE